MDDLFLGRFLAKGLFSVGEEIQIEKVLREGEGRGEGVRREGEILSLWGVWFQILFHFGRFFIFLKLIIHKIDR